MDFSQEYNKPLFIVREADGQTSFGYIQSPNLKVKLASLYAYLAKRLGIAQTPKVVFTNNPQNAANPFGFTGYYDHDTMTIRIYITGRHDTDILRSFAHEVIHHWQNLRGTLQPKGQQSLSNTGGNGHTHYAQDDAWLRKREMEAYLFGNILFRDWQDENRLGPPKVQPALPQPFDENLAVVGKTGEDQTGDVLRNEVHNFVQRLISNKIFTSYDRALQTATMNPQDFAEDLTNKILSAIHEWTDTMNDRSDWENETNSTEPSAMIK